MTPKIFLGLMFVVIVTGLVVVDQCVWEGHGFSRVARVRQ